MGESTLVGTDNCSTYLVVTEPFVFWTVVTGKDTESKPTFDVPEAMLMKPLSVTVKPVGVCVVTAMAIAA